MMDELLSPLLTTAWGRRSGVAMIILMVVLSFFTLVQMIFSWRSDMRLSQSQATQVDTTVSDQLATMIAKIPDQHLFGRQDVSDLPITSLQLRLVGVIKASPEKFSRVIISESNQPGKVYQIGDTLPSSGVKINAITADGVVLENGGRFEKLPLQRAPLQFQPKPKALLGE